MSLEAKNYATDPYERLSLMQNSFVQQHLLALRLEDREEIQAYRILWDDTGEFILPLLEQLGKRNPISDSQFRVGL
jgi:hypothetical protein